MTSGFRKPVTLLLCLALLGILSVCYLLTELALGAALSTSQSRDPNSHRTEKNHHEPEILISNEDVIRIKYLSVGPNAEYEQATRLISDHCDGAYTETNRVELRGYTTIDAECTHGSEPSQ